MITANYFEALTTFRDLLDDGVDAQHYSEYVRGGINLIADLFPIYEQPVDERMEQVHADLLRIPQFAGCDAGNLGQYGVTYNYLPID